MKIYEFTPQKNTKKLGMITGILIIGAAVLMLATMFFGHMMPYRWTIQLLGILMLVVGVFITARYIMKSFVYAIIEADDGYDLTITEIQGRHTITVCRIALSSIEQVKVVEAGDRETNMSLKNKIREEKRKSYNYCADILDEKYACIFSIEGGEAIAIKLSFDQKLTELLTPATEAASAETDDEQQTTEEE